VDESIYYDVGGQHCVRVTAALGIVDTGLGDWKAAVGKAEAFRVSREASGIGTKTHNLIEKDIKSDKPENPRKADGKEAGIAFGAYRLWRDEMKPLIERSEQFVWSPTHKYAGTMDVLGGVDSDTVYDFKTSKKLHKSYWLQLAAYAAALMELDKTRKIKWLVVVRLDKELGTYREYRRAYSDDLFHSFLASLRLWRYYNIEPLEEEENDRGNEGFNNTIASLDIEPTRPWDRKAREVKKVARPEVFDVGASEIW
jgi:hypothetical protein